jgi:hypothetical protein
MYNPAPYITNLVNARPDMRKSKSHRTQRQDAVKYGRVSSKEQEKEGFSIPA